jgi:hypothetical protein
MARAFFVRLASAAALLSLSFFLVGLIPFLSVGPSVGANYVAKTSASRVNRTFKSDRLPLPSETNSALTNGEPQRPQKSENAKNVPEGCDRSFSPITAPQLANVYGRCTT